jgi:hypothetical protein
MHLELGGLGGNDSATRICDPAVLPVGTVVWVTKDYSALVTAYGVRLGDSRSRDVLEIFVSARRADNGFADKKDPDATAAYLQGLAAKGWALNKRKK